MLLDGTAVGTTGEQPLTVPEVAAGKHEVVAEKAGHAPARQQITVAAGQIVSVNLTLQPAAVAGAVGSFTGLEHAMELVGEIRGIRFVNDSKATNIDAARQALALKPDYAEAFNNIAAAHASLRQWDEAIRAAQEALRLRPDFPLARNNLAWAEGESRKAKAGGL